MFFREVGKVLGGGVSQKTCHLKMFYSEPGGWFTYNCYNDKKSISC